MRPVGAILIATIVLNLSGVPVAEARQRDPNCYVDLHGVFKAREVRAGFYTGLIGSGIGVGFVLWGTKSHKKSSVATGVGMIAAGTALAVYYGRQQDKYRNVETCGMRFFVR